MLQLLRPIVFFDIEATGLDTENDRIVELAICKLFPDGTKEVKTNRYNPGMPIPPESTEIHKITDEDVKDKPMFLQHAKAILEYLQGCDLAGFNSNRYDVPMLFNEMARAGQYLNYRDMNLIDVGNIFKIKEARTLEAGYKFYTGKDLVNAHTAEADILATVEVFEKQLEKYDLPTDIKELALFSNYDAPILDLAGKFTQNKEGVILLNFGKYKGMPANEHIDFLEWMVYKASFSKDTTDLALEIMHEGFNTDNFQL